MKTMTAKYPGTCMACGEPIERGQRINFHGDGHVEHVTCGEEHLDRTPRPESACPRSTPWGRADHVKTVAPGIARVDTPGHGGYWLSRARMAEMPAALRAFKTFAGGNWYEEDCDWVIPMLAFPSAFDDCSMFHAVRVVRSPHWYDEAKAGPIRAWLESDAGATVRAGHDRFAATVAGKWETGGMGSSGDGWTFWVSRDGERRTCWSKDYPSKGFWTTEEVEAMTPPAKVYPAARENDSDEVFAG